MSKTACVHIFATQLFLGKDLELPTRVPSLTALKRNTRSGKKSGRKYRDNEEIIVVSVEKEINQCLVCKGNDIKYWRGKKCSICDNWVHNRCLKRHNH